MNGALRDGLTTLPIPLADSPCSIGVVTARASCQPTVRLGTGTAKLAKPCASVVSDAVCPAIVSWTSTPTRRSAA